MRAALQTIGEIRESSFTRAVPDISESLRLLRQHLAFIEAADAEADADDDVGIDDTDEVEVETPDAEPEQ